MQDQAIFSVILDQLIYLSISKDYIKYCFFGVYVYISDQPMKNHDTNSNVRSSTNRSSLSGPSFWLMICLYGK